MDAAAISKYIDGPFAEALAFYDDRAIVAKRWYRTLTIYVVVVSAVLAPLIAFAPSDTGWRILSASLSASIVLATGLLGHLRSHENWLAFRSAWDALKRERRLFETSAGAYTGSVDPGRLFVDRVEAILGKEGADFYSRHAKGKDNARSRRKEL